MTVDPFTRTVTNGFGTGPHGAYALAYDSFVVGDVAGTLSVNGAQGIVALHDSATDPDVGGAYRRALPVGAGLAFSEQQVDIVFSSSASANNVTVGVLLRFVDLSHYWIVYGTDNGGNWRLNFSDQSTSFGSGSTAIPYGAGAYRLAARACTDPDFPDYTAIVAKFWRPGVDSEPAWSAPKYPPFTPASGQCGLFVGGSLSFGTGSVAFDDYTITANPCDAPPPVTPRQRLYWIG